MAKSQMCPAYADFGRLAYRGMPLMSLDLWPFQNLRRIFTNSPWVKDYSMMKIADVIRESPTEYTYELDSPKLVLGYFETVPGSAGAEFPSKEVLITPHSQIGKPEGRILEPASSNWSRAVAATREDAISLTIPTFIDDVLAVLIESAEDPSYQTTVDAAKLTATVDGGKVRLSWDQNVQGMIARVHRRNQIEVQAGGPFSRPTLIAGTTELSLVDEAAGPGSWEYSIVWKDEENRHFYESNNVVVTVPDVPPVTPEIRIVKSGETRAVLWAPGNLEPDIRRYEWERRSRGDSAWAPIDSTAHAYFEDRSLEKNVPVEYRVRAVDLANAASEFSVPLTVTPGERRDASAFGSLEQPFRKRMRPLLFVLFAGLGLLAGILWGMRARRRRA
jgi:hypothetical protein